MPPSKNHAIIHTKTRHIFVAVLWSKDYVEVWENWLCAQNCYENCHFSHLRHHNTQRIYCGEIWERDLRNVSFFCEGVPSLLIVFGEQSLYLEILCLRNCEHSNVKFLLPHIQYIMKLQKFFTKPHKFVSHVFCIRIMPGRAMGKNIRNTARSAKRMVLVSYAVICTSECRMCCENNHNPHEVAYFCIHCTFNINSTPKINTVKWFLKICIRGLLVSSGVFSAEREMFHA